MSALKGKHILLAVSGGIAAYKIPFLVRLLRTENMDVRVVITNSAQQFVSPLTLASLSGNPVEHDLVLKDSGNISWNSHVDLAGWADVIVVAPATSNTIGKYVNGICDNLLLATILSSKCKVFWAPAMDLDMFDNPANQMNLEKLRAFGHIVFPSPSGYLASGLTGPGRMVELDLIVLRIRSHFLKRKYWQNKNVVITSGPTRELIDPVRFISNGSTGRTGLELVKVLSDYGAMVTWIHGPSRYHQSGLDGVTYRPVTSAMEMRDEAMAIWPKSHIFIGAAAVSDYRPKNVAKEKIKKENAAMESIKFELNPDILTEIGRNRLEGQYVLGFALETENGLKNARSKLTSKSADAIVLNFTDTNNATMDSENNTVSIITSKNIDSWPIQSKKSIASNLVYWMEHNWKI